MTRRGGVGSASPAAGANGAVKLISGLYIAPGVGTVTTFALSVDALHLTPFDVQAFTLEEIGLEVTTAAASGVARIGVYATASPGGPGALLWQSPSALDTSTTGVKLHSGLSVPISAGRIWVGLVAQVAGATFRILDAPSGPSVAIGDSVATTVSQNVLGAYTQSGVSGALPDPFVRSGASRRIPRILIKAA